MYDAAEREMDLYRNEIARITAERDKLRELRGVVDHFAETWAELMVTLPDDYGCEMNCAEANAAAALFRALGDNGTANAIIAAHVATDDDEERASHDEAGEPTGGAT